MSDLTYATVTGSIAIVVVIGLFLYFLTMSTSLEKRDHRMFNDIAQECEEKGFIQNHQIRIMCEVEK